MKKYLFVFDSSETTGFSNKIQPFISNSRYIDQWSLVFSGLYFFKSSAEFKLLYDSLKDFFGETSILLCEIDPNDDTTSGYLPKGIWGWLRTDGALALGAASSRGEQDL
jgi:hypothetical protein